MVSNLFATCDQYEKNAHTWSSFAHAKVAAEPSPDGLPRAAMRVVAASFDHHCSQYPLVEGNDFSLVDPGHDPKPARAEALI